MAYAYITPTQALLDKCPMLFGESSRPQAEIFADEADFFTSPFSSEVEALNGTQVAAEKTRRVSFIWRIKSSVMVEW